MVDFEDLNIASNGIEIMTLDCAKILAPFSNYLSIKKNQNIILDRGINNEIYFILKGHCRQFDFINGYERTRWFGEPGDMICSFHQLFGKERRLETISSLTDMDIVSIKMNKFLELSDQFLTVQKFYSKTLEMGYLYWEKRFDLLATENAEERYRVFAAGNKLVVDLVPIKILAQYLDISYPSLSRIRKNYQH